MPVWSFSDPRSQQRGRSLSCGGDGSGSRWCWPRWKAGSPPARPGPNKYSAGVPWAGSPCSLNSRCSSNPSSRPGQSRWWSWIRPGNRCTRHHRWTRPASRSIHVWPITTVRQPLHPADGSPSPPVAEISRCHAAKLQLQDRQAGPGSESPTGPAWPPTEPANSPRQDPLRRRHRSQARLCPALQRRQSRSPALADEPDVRQSRNLPIT